MGSPKTCHSYSDIEVWTAPLHFNNQITFLRIQSDCDINILLQVL